MRAKPDQQLPPSAHAIAQGGDVTNRGAGAILHFGRCSMLLGARLLLRDGQPVDLGSRAFDLLAALIKARGTIVTKSEIMEYVWPSTTVDESNLRFQMAVLRRVLGAERHIIKTVTGRGYLFSADVVEHAGPGSSAAAAARPEAAADLSAFDPVHLSWLQDTRPRSVRDNSSPRVVIVFDDDRALCDALRRMLCLAGLRVEFFTSVSEFLTRP